MITDPGWLACSENPSDSETLHQRIWLRTCNGLIIDLIQEGERSMKVDQRKETLEWGQGGW